MSVIPVKLLSRVSYLRVKCNCYFFWVFTQGVRLVVYSKECGRECCKLDKIKNLFAYPFSTCMPVCPSIILIIYLSMRNAAEGGYMKGSRLSGGLHVCQYMFIYVFWEQEDKRREDEEGACVCVCMCVATCVKVSTVFLLFAGSGKGSKK